MVQGSLGKNMEIFSEVDLSSMRQVFEPIGVPMLGCGTDDTLTGELSKMAAPNSDKKSKKEQIEQSTADIYAELDQPFKSSGI